MDNNKDIYAVLGEIYYSLVTYKRLYEQKDAENKVKDDMIKNLKDKLNERLNDRGSIQNS